MLSPAAPTELMLVFDLALSLVIGYIIGLEREERGKAAGIATQCLVIGGAALFTFISTTFIDDQARISAGIVTGIGFLGAGVILHGRNDKVINLTTAGTIWFSAAIGMAIGYGYYVSALAATLFALMVVRIPHIRVLFNGKKKK